MVVSNMINITDMTELLAYANTNTAGYFWFGMLVIFFMILLVTFIKYDIEIAAVLSGFISFTIGLLFVYAGLMAWYLDLVFFGVAFLSLINIAWIRRQN